jgi:hypothetical protein
LRETWRVGFFCCARVSDSARRLGFGAQGPRSLRWFRRAHCVIHNFRLFIEQRAGKPITKGVPCKGRTEARLKVSKTGVHKSLILQDSVGLCITQCAKPSRENASRREAGKNPRTAYVSFRDRYGNSRAIKRPILRQWSNSQIGRGCYQSTQFLLSVRRQGPVLKECVSSAWRLHKRKR